MKLLSFTPMGRRLIKACSETALSLFSDGCHGSRNPDEELIIVTPHIIKKSTYLGMPKDIVWADIYLAWEKIQSSQSKMEMNAWRVIWNYGQEIAPGLNIFRIRQSEIHRYFCLLPEEGFFQSMDRLIGLFFPFSSWLHTSQGRGVVHAAGIFRENMAYLFVGPSGAGKTTVANLSSGCGYTVIHDDHSVVCPTQAGRYMISESSLSKYCVLLKAVFFLVKDTTNQLVPCSSLEMAKGLVMSFLDGMGQPILFGQTLRKAFATCASIARSVPAYELHFRKSPDFWDMIDAELGN